jgi:hypothetical protein
MVSWGSNRGEYVTNARFNENRGEREQSGQWHVAVSKGMCCWSIGFVLMSSSQPAFLINWEG